jgi:hypothetical protein
VRAARGSTVRRSRTRRAATVQNPRRGLEPSLGCHRVGCRARRRCDRVERRPRATLRVRPTTVSPGAQVRVSGNAAGCPLGDTVMVLSRAFAGKGFAGFGSIPARVRAGGAFAATGRVRRYARAGRYAVTARCGGGNLGVTAYLRVR